MKHLLLTASLAIGNSLFVHSQSISKQDDTTNIQMPKVYLQYFANGTPFDRSVFRLANKPVDEDLMREAGRRVEEFQELWDKEGPDYFNTVFSEINLPFPYKEIHGAFTVSGVPSTNTPLIINVVPFLSLAKKPFPIAVFSEIVFHELLHVYLRGITDRSTFRKKYMNESLTTRNHLHLMALEKFVLLKLGKTDLLKWLDNDYRKGDLPPDYRKAWEIVNDKEGYEVFIEELKWLVSERKQ
ncbi:MAG TPA: hypothetical protein VM368_01880 [Flavisolibacter sp.]|nr:hypothetical protein [Flavisolibacter sp.]